MRMRVHAALAAALSLLALMPARAADNYQVKAVSGTITIKAKEVASGVYAPQQVPSDATGTPYGAGNPLAVTLPSGQVVVLGAGSAAIGSVAVSNFPATQAISATALPLPAGAATAAKQPGIGAAGTPSADVLSVQGVVGGVAQGVDTVVRATATSRSIVIPVAGVSAAVSAGGTGHAVGDVLTQTGGTCTVQPRWTVATVASGAVATLTLQTAGSCTVLATAPVATTSSGAGTGATLTPAYASIPTQVMAGNPNRRGFMVQPQGLAAYLSGLTTASADQASLKLPADALYESLPHHVGTGAISVVGTAGLPLPLYAREY